MPKVSSRCELMDNAFPAGPLKLRGNFFVTQDETGENMLFSVDKDGTLRLILKGENGINESINLSDKFGLADNETVRALSVNQNLDGIIHLVFATLQTDGSTKLYVVEPMTAVRSVWKPSGTLVGRLYTGEQWPVNIREFLMLPVNPHYVLDMCAANLRLYRGLFVLYKESESIQLRFVGLNPTKANPTLTSIAQPVPDGATKLASFKNKSGLTDLLISGTHGLTYRSAQECFSGSHGAPAVVTNDPAFTETTQIHVAQCEEKLSVWSLGNQRTLAYQEFSRPENTGEVPAQLTMAIPLLDEIFGHGRFTAVRNQHQGQKLFIVDGGGVMKVLEQSPESAIWQRPAEVMMPDSDKMVEFSSHTIHLSVNEDDGGPRANQPVRILSSTSAELIVNGACIRSVPGTPETVLTDDEGSLTVIIRSEGLSAPIITFADPNTEDNVFAGGKLAVDPMSKLWSTVGTVSSGQDLKAMKMPDGASFVREDVPSSDLDQAADALKNLHQVKREMDSESTSWAVSSARGPSLADRFWGALYWVCDKVKQGWNFVVKKVKQAWEFILEIGGKVWNFVLETVQHVAAAIQTVLSAVTKGWEWIKQKLAFIFSWGDILAVKNVFVNLTTHGMLFAADGAALMELKVQSLFEDVRVKLRELKKAKLPPELLNLHAGKDDKTEREAKAASGADAGKMHDAENESKSPQAQYASYHVKHGGTSAGGRTEGQDVFDRILLRMKKALEQADQLASRLADNISDLFSSSTNLSIGDLLAKLGFDLLDDVLGVIESLITSILGCLGDLIVEVADKINKPIQIPVLSALYRKINRGNDLTILDAACLVMAVPTTIIFKVVSGQSPTELEGIESLTRPNALRSELDERLGRLRSEQQQKPNAVVAGSHIEISKGNTVATPLVDCELTSDESIVGTKQVDDSDLGRTVTLLRSQSNELVPSKGVPNSSGQADIDKMKQDVASRSKRFSKDMSVAGKVIKIGVPVGAGIIYNCFSYPGIFTAEKTGKSRFVSPCFRLVLWCLQFGQLANWGEGNFFSKFDELAFLQRFMTWTVGGFAIMCAFVSKTLGNTMGMIMGFLQGALLAWAQIEEATAFGGYSVYLGFEEWLKCIGKLLNCSAAVVKGPLSLKLAVLACMASNGGTAMHFSRAVAEVTGVTETLYTGMDLVA
ncbi:hypothetical protein G7Z17_g1483 [Cylindrodendrum hubeiense]|uniref:Uncharacterized protein n=1 Tax=Cylindrodendrum hubeiense TaxID=595255 RepID=A0A9P5LK13_9HYPO|nr:hypothetical protein G7Z17_g1483 [Cylindrodendrum hubeiense]